MRQSFPRARRYSVTKVSRVTLVSLAFLGGTVMLCSCARLSRRQATTKTGSSLVLVTDKAVADLRPAAKRININTASANELESLPGVGKVLATRIVAHREQYGLFRRAEHLMMVRGFSDNKFRSIRDLVAVE